MSSPSVWSDALLPTNPTAGPGWVNLRKSANGLVGALATVSKSIRCDDSKRMVSSVISTPMADLQGDEVIPSGFDLTYHRQLKTVLYDHGVDYKFPVGLAEDPNGNYTVRLVGDRLIADTYFAPNKMGEDLYDLCKSDVLRGWSATFVPLEPGTPIGDFNKSLRRCPMRFHSQKLLEYSVTPNPINVEALTILAEKGRGGNGVFHEAIQKSLSAFARIARPVSVGVPPHPLILPRTPVGRVGKSMNDEATGMGSDPAAMAGPTPTARHSYDGAQGVSDIADHLEQGLTQCEHAKGKKKLKKILDDLRAIVDELKANGDMVGSDMDDKPEEQDAMVDDPEPVEKSATGLILITKAHYEPKRWTTKDLAAAEGTAGTDVEPGPTRKSRAERDAEREETKKARALARIQAKYGKLAAV